jgi:hypothetical protein
MSLRGSGKMRSGRGVAHGLLTVSALVACASEAPPAPRTDHDSTKALDGGTAKQDEQDEQDDQPARMNDASKAPRPSADASGSAGPRAPGSDAAAMGMESIPKTQPDAGACPTPTSAFAAIEQTIFAKRGCTAAACHGTAGVGGLTLSAGGALAGLVNAKSENSQHPRVKPGAPNESFLYLKLKAATDPGSVAIAGSPMPVASEPLTTDELAAVRLWIEAGAPESGGDAQHAATLEQVIELLAPCGGGGADAGVAQPPADPYVVTLAPPEKEQGVQLTMPPIEMKSASEWEGCFASYYDLGTVVPKRFQSPDGQDFYVKATQIQQSLGSHHLVIMHSGLDASVVDDRSFGPWSCKGGTKAGTACDPLVSNVCDDGVCGTDAKRVPACFGFGPLGATANPASFGLGTALQANVKVDAIEGVFRKVPLRGIVYWNLHAFNLTKEDHQQQAKLNLMFTDDLREEEQHLSISGSGYTGLAPFTKKDVCSTWEAPQGSRLIRLSSHTHRHGEHFWIKDPQGKQIYESFTYSDPAYIVLDPPISFTSTRAADRTLTFCSTFNNGLRADGTLDTELVTRRSRVPDYAFSACDPTACAEGKVGTACNSLLGGDTQCDSARGQGDGKCDACPIVNGETTEHEMFFMLPDIVTKPL